MSVVEVKLGHGKVFVEFGPTHPNDPAKYLSNVRGNVLKHSNPDAFSVEYQNPVFMPIYPSRQMENFFFRMNDVLNKVGKSGKPIDLLVLDVPVTGSEHTANERRVGLSKWLKLVAGVVTASPAIEAGTRAINKWRGKGKKELMSRREFLQLGKKIVPLGIGIAVLGELINPNLLSWPANWPGREGPVRRKLREAAASIHAVSPSFIIEGRSAIMAQKLDSILHVLQKQLGRNAEIAVVGPGGMHGDLVEMLKHPVARKKVLLDFYARIQQLPLDFTRKVYLYRFDPSNPQKKFKKVEIEIPPLFTPQEEAEIRRRIGQSRRVAPRERLVREKIGGRELSRRDVLFGRFGNRSPRRRA